MNTILEQINSAGFVFVKFALPMLVQSAVLIVVLLLADLLLRKKVRAVVRYWLWTLVLLKLVLPTTLSSPVSLGSWFGDKLATVKFSETSTPAESVNSPQMIDTGTVAVTGTPQADVKPTATRSSTAASLLVSPTPLTRQGIVFLVWAAVVAAMGLLLLQRAIFVNGLVTQAQNPTQLMNDAFRFCCGQMGTKAKISLKVSANTASPAVCGLFRPVILVPQNLAPTLGSSRLRPVLLHELAHIKRGDLWINLAQTVLQIIYFYNPLLWLANSIIRRIREQAVDEAVQVAMGANASQYPQTLVDVAKIAFNRPVLSLRLIGVVESKSALKGRIERMLNRPIPKNANLGILGLVTLIIVGFMLLPMAKAAKPEKVNQNPIGKWQSVDFVQKIKDFTPGEKSWQGELYLKNVKFMKNGKTSSFFTWKKNLIQHNNGRTEAAYQIREMNGSRYLFLPWLSGDVTIRGQKPKYYVMKEVKGNKKNESEFIVALGRNITVEEGVGFDGFVVGDANCTGEFIKSKLGEPDEENKNKKKGWWLNYREKYGLDFWLNLQENTLYEIRINKGFKGKLTSGISMSSTKQDVFDVYGQPIREEVAEDFDQRFDNQVLLFRKPAWVNRWRKPHLAKIYYNEHGLLFWFDGDTIDQIVVSPKSNQPLSEDKIIVPGVRVGDYTFDMSKDDVLKNLGKPKVIFYGEERYTLDNLPKTYYMSFDDVSFRILDDSVKEITVHSPFYKFTNELGVGSSEQKIKQAFGDNFHLKKTEWKDFLTYEDEGLEFEIHKNNRTVMEINVLRRVPDESLKYEPIRKPNFKTDVPSETYGVNEVDNNDKMASGNFAAEETSGKEPKKIVEQAVMTISTCAETDPRVKQSLESLLGLDEQAVVKEIVKFLDSGKSTVRRSAIYILWKGDFKSIKPAELYLLNLCSHEEEYTRGMAALALGAKKVEPCFDTLCNMTLNDSSPYARRCAAYALGLIGNPEAKEVLEKAMKDSDLNVRNNAEAALTMLSQVEKPKSTQPETKIKDRNSEKSKTEVQ